MSEGELKIVINDCRSVMGDYILIDEVMQAIDKAKKKFPQKRDIKRSDLKATEPVDKATYGELIQGLEALKWFKTQFGE